MSSQWYFAYGNNLNPERMKARGLVFEERIKGQLPHYSLCFNKRAHNKEGIAYANIQYAKQHNVEGALYKLSNLEAIQELDPFEGCPVRYSREVFPIQSSQGSINAWIYIANKAMLCNQVLPEDRYIQHLLAGSDLLSESYINNIKQQATIKTESSKGGVESLKFNI